MSASSVARTCLELVRTPSPCGQEDRVCSLIEQRLARLGTRHERLGNAIIARTGAATDTDAVALVGHLDTVPDWDGGEARITAERIIGRGSADMKGGDAVMLELCEQLRDTSRPVVYVFYDREEGPHDQNGIHTVLKHATLLGRPGFAVVLEPTSNTVHAGAVGTLNADVVFTGRAAHAARPWEGDNAITQAAAALTRLRDHAARPVLVEGLRFFDTIAVTTAHGGTARNVIPDRFTLAVNARAAPGRPLDDARADVETLAGADATVQWLDAAQGAPPGLDQPPVRRFVDETGVDVHPKQAWTDVATLHAAGIPAVNFGPGDSAQAHQRGEWVALSALDRCLALLTRYLTGT
jgi:succinyl-diaminopimelate desuccinylase